MIPVVKILLAGLLALQSVQAELSCSNGDAAVSEAIEAVDSNSPPNAIQHPPTKSRNNKRTQISGSALTPTASKLSTSKSDQVSAIVDCVNSAGACSINTTSTYAFALTSTYITNDSVSVAGISASAMFGENYSDMEPSETGLTFFVSKGQKGYASEYCTAELFTGKYTGCSGSQSTVPGSIVALEKNGLIYGQVNPGG